MVANGTSDLPDHVRVEADPVLVEAARRLDPPQLRRVIGHLQLVADPDGAGAQAERRHQRRGLWLAPTFDQMVAIDGLLEPEAGQTLLAALEPLARPADATDTRSGSQRNADALTELARRALEGGRLPQTGGVRPQLSVVVDLDSLLGRPGTLGGEVGGMGPLAPETCRRLACDRAVTRVVVTRHPTHRQHLTDPSDDQDHLATGHPGGHHHPGHGPGAETPWPAGDPGAQGPPVTGQLSAGASAIAHDPTETPGAEGLEMRLRAAMALLPPSLGGAPAQPLDVGRATRVVQPA
ncbi:MAG TPA: DUF222 domain-containing protein, partial [Actinomycetes bacterium]|nr:DUF222 domain-containing protein [Actinomycetes bacterium]